MLELNKTLITGRLTRDPEIRMTQAGKTVGRLNIAINRKGWNGQPDEVTYVEVIVWEKQAEFARSYLHKGSAVFVEGRLKMETWQDKDTGANRSKLQIVAERVAFAEPKADREYDGPSKRQQVNTAMSGERPMREAQRAQAAADDTEDDLPF